MPYSTSWLQDAAGAAMSALLARLDLERAARPYFWVDLKRNPPEAQHSYWDHCDIAGRFVDGLALARLITGRQDAQDAESQLREFLWSHQDPGDGLFYNPDAEVDASDAEMSKYIPGAGVLTRPRHADLFCQRAPLLAMTTLLLLGDESMRPRLQRMVTGLSSIARQTGDEISFPTYRWAPVLKPEWTHGASVPERWLGYRYALLTALARYAQAAGDPRATELGLGLARFYMRHGDVPPDGRFRGNTHSGGILPTVVGIARLGAHAGDRPMIEWADRVYRWVREQTPDFGFLRDGLGLEGFFATTCETCALADYIHLAVLLTEAGAGDYWDDVERVARNQLIENQYRDAEAIRTAFPGIPDRVLSMLIGGFECAAYPNDLLTWDGAEGCCIGGGIRALYLAWRASVTETGDETRVNLGITRATPHAEVMAHEPVAGRIDARARTARRVSIRLPGHAGIDQARAFLDGQEIRAEWRGRYAAFGLLRPGQTASLGYPLRERRGNYDIAGQEYQADWVGHTVIRMSPPGTRHPIYQRRNLTHILARAPEEDQLMPASPASSSTVAIW